MCNIWVKNTQNCSFPSHYHLQMPLNFNSSLLTGKQACNQLTLYHVSKNCAKLFLSERCQISAKCENFWHIDGKEDKLKWNALTFHLTLLLLSWRARQALPIWGDKDVPKRWGIQPDSESGGIRLSLVIVDSHLLSGHHSMAAVVAHSWRIVNHCQTIDVDGWQQTVKLQLVVWLCSGIYRSKDQTNSI